MFLWGPGGVAAGVAGHGDDGEDEQVPVDDGQPRAVPRLCRQEGRGRAPLPDAAPVPARARGAHHPRHGARRNEMK
eukprot:8919701-Pyramimonas_sp.AAC.1